jgi:hypothetical protein
MQNEPISGQGRNAMEARSDSGSASGLLRKQRVWIGASVAAFAAMTSLSAAAQQDGERTVDKVADKVHTVNSSIEAYVSGKTIDLQYYRELGIEGVGPVQASVGFLYNEERDLVGIFDALVYLGDEARQREIEVSVGTRVFAAFLNQENEDTLGVGFGGQAEWFFNQKRRSSLRLSAFYAPDILTFGIANNIRDYGLDLQTRLGATRPTFAFVGFRHLEVDTVKEAVSGNRNLDNELHIGFRRMF